MHGSRHRQCHYQHYWHKNVIGDAEDNTYFKKEEMMQTHSHNHQLTHICPRTHTPHFSPHPHQRTQHNYLFAHFISTAWSKPFLRTSCGLIPEERKKSYRKGKWEKEKEHKREKISRENDQRKLDRGRTSESERLRERVQREHARGKAREEGRREREENIGVRRACVHADCLFVWEYVPVDTHTQTHTHTHYWQKIALAHTYQHSTRNISPFLILNPVPVLRSGKAPDWLKLYRSRHNPCAPTPQYGIGWSACAFLFVCLCMSKCV